MSVSKNMPRMFEYQRKIVENENAKMIVGNFSRNTGKSYTMACKILHDRPSLVFFVANSDSQFKSLRKKFEEILALNEEVKADIFYIGYLKEKITITFVSGEIVNIYNYREFKVGDCIQRKIPKLLLYSDCLPVNNILGKQIISMVSMPIDDLKVFFVCEDVVIINAGLKELVDNSLMDRECIEELKEDDKFFRKEVDIFNEYETIFGEEIEPKINYKEWIDKQIHDLMNEFSGITKNDRTTMTREKVLGLIDNLVKMKSNFNIK